MSLDWFRAPLFNDLFKLKQNIFIRSRSVTDETRRRTCMTCWPVGRGLNLLVRVI